MRKAFIWIGIIVLAPVIYNLDAIFGQWKFDRLCEKEGGSKFYGMVEKDVGWEVLGRDTYDYQWPFSFGNISFVRYQNKEGERFDIRSNGYTGPNQRNYIFSPVDDGRLVRYRFLYSSSSFPDDDRFSKTVFQVVDVASGVLLAQHTIFGYQWTKPERVLLAAPTGVGCWNLQADMDKFYSGIYQIKDKP